MKQALTIGLALAALQSFAQSEWTLRQCMQYAVEHNHEVRRTALELDNRLASRTGAIGRFLPSLGANIGTQYNFGRAINPETNGYTDVNTFNNGYSLYASLPVFEGFGRIHALKAAKAGTLMGRAALQRSRDLTALGVLEAATEVAYYEGMTRMAAEKAQETALLLRQTLLMEEVGRKSAADVAQVESQQAEADYNLTYQQNRYASALLELKTRMGFSLNDSLRPIIIPCAGEVGPRTGSGEEPAELQVARYQMQVSRHEWRQARAALFPSLTLNVGANTAYYHTLHDDAGQAFRSQFKNNRGEYVGATLSIPLFNRLQTLTGIRRAKNNYHIACEHYEEKRQELEKLALEAWQEWQAYVKQTEQMRHKTQADSLAYQLTRRQFEEGLSTAVDLRTTSAQLLHSRATLLQCQLMAMVKEQFVRYYRGETIWTE